MPRITQELLVEIRDYLGGFATGPAADFARDIAWGMEERPLEPAPLACLRHLDRCAALADDTTEPMARLLSERGARLHWGQTYTAADFGQDFVDKYGWVELFGTRGHFANDRVAAGFLLLGPRILYPDHHHEAEEVYIPLTGGTLWRKGDADFAARQAGEVIHHPSNVNHAMRTGDEPLLALYLWRGGPLAARSTVTGTAADGGT